MAARIAYLIFAFTLFANAFAQEALANANPYAVKVAHQSNSKRASIKAPRRAADESELVTHTRYRNKAGNTVHSPSKAKSGKLPSGASAKCGDGSYSFSQNGRGTCSRHGGVASWR